MERNIGNVIFALFAVMLSMGALFADTNGTIIANSQPVITGMGGPTSINVGEAGTWSVSAYDPDGNYLYYSVNWGDSSLSPSAPASAGSTATFQHTYSSAGTYTITFTVLDNQMGSTQSTITTTVGGSSNSGLQIVRVWQQDESFEPVHMLYAEIKDGSDVANLNNVKVTLQMTTPNGKTENYNIGYHSPGTVYSHNNYYGFGFSKGSQCGTYHYVVTAQRNSGSSAATVKEGSFSIGSSCSSSDNSALSTLGKISYWSGKVNQHTDANGAWQTDSDGTSGADLDKIAYCKKFYPGTTDIKEASVETNSGWKDAGNSGSYTSVKAVYKCVGTYVAPSNQPPVITGGSGPASLSVNQQGTWTISAYDPDGTYLTYSVNWGDAGLAPLYRDAGSSATFQHTYAQAGTYTITFTVTDNLGASTQSTSWMTVGSSTSTGNGLEIVSVWVSPDKYNANSNIFYVNLLDNGKVATGSDIEASYALTTPNGGKWSGKMSLGDENNPYITMGIGSGDGCGTYSYTVTAKRISAGGTGAGNYAEKSGTFVLSPPYCTSVSSNLPPVITSVGGPAEISAGKSGTWKVSAYDPDGKYLYYSVNWGESGKTPSASDSPSSTATFQHTYAQAGTYTITFTVLDDQMAKTESTLSVKVTGGSSASEVYASVGATPTEVNQYDTVYVTGKVSRGTASANDGAQTYRVVLSFDNGNEIPKTASAEGTVASTSVASSGQAREEEITLYPGGSEEVTAYFTASKLGTNFAKIMVYQKGSDRCKEMDYDTGASDQATRCGNYYTLVASDSTKVYVKESGIPQPPSEGVTIVLAKGWNQISVPVSDLEVSKLAEKCDISTNVWYYSTDNKQYEKAAILGGAHVGYWVKANSACKYTIDTPYITPAPNAFNLKAGWNMIGAPLSATAISNMAGNCKITSGPWNYSPAASQYTYSEKLEPGKGYWVKVASDCTLGSASDMPPPVPTVESAQAVTPAASVEQVRTG